MKKAYNSLPLPALTLTNPSHTSFQPWGQMLEDSTHTLKNLQRPLFSSLFHSGDFSFHCCGDSESGLSSGTCLTGKGFIVSVGCDWQYRS